MKIVSLKPPELLLKQITSLAKKRGEGRSSLMRKAIESLVQKNHDPDELSCLDLTNDIAGSVAGADDLSVNKERLTGYGQ